MEVKPRKFLLDTTIEDAAPTVRTTDIKDKDAAAKPTPTPTPITQFYEEVSYFPLLVWMDVVCKTIVNGYIMIRCVYMG